MRAFKINLSVTSAPKRMDSTKLKGLLKTIKLHENTLSAVFGVLFIIISGFVLLTYITKDKGEVAIPVSADETATQPKTHKVQKGEDLWKIAEKYYGDGYKWVDIAKTNSMKNPGLIQVDQELNLPEIEKNEATEKADSETDSSKSTVTPTISPSPQVVDNNQAITADTYTVVKGDNLWTICVRAYNSGYKWIEIAKVNNLSNPNLILPGMSLTLPR